MGKSLLAELFLKTKGLSEEKGLDKNGHFATKASELPA
jgi:hypothetical protein